MESWALLLPDPWENKDGNWGTTAEFLKVPFQGFPQIQFRHNTTRTWPAKPDINLSDYLEVTGLAKPTCVLEAMPWQEQAR
jgi:hypothetical protein